MASTHRLLAISFAFALVFAAACSTTPDAGDEGPTLEKSSAEDLLQTDDVLVAARINPDELSDLTPLFQRLAQAADDPAARQLADISPDPLGHLESTHEMPNDLSALADDQPSYVLLSSRGHEALLQSAMLGLPTYTDEWPAYFNLRLLLPAADPGELDEQLGPWLDEFQDDDLVQAHETYEGPGFVRLELAVKNHGYSAGDADVDAAQWLAGLDLDELTPPPVADFRPTPAYETFVDSDVPFGIWSPVETFATLGTYELLELVADEYTKTGDAGKPRAFMEGIGRIAVASAVDDPVSAENEDLAILVSTVDDALTVDFFTTRTEQGQTMRRATSTPIAIPGFDTNSPFLNLDFQADLQAVGESAAVPHWSTLESLAVGEQAGVDFDQPEAVDDSPLPFSDDPAGFPVLTAAVQYPWASFASAQQAIEEVFPMPRAIALEAFASDDPGFALPVGGVAVATFEDDAQTRTMIEYALGMGENAIPGEFDAELIYRDDDLLEVHIAVGAELSRVIGAATEQRNIGDPSLSLNMTAVQQQMAGLLPGGEFAEFFDRIHLRSAGHDTYHTHRLTIGSETPLDPVDAATTADIEPLAQPTNRCRTQMAAASVQHLTDLRGDSAGAIDRWADEVSRLADECLDDEASVELVEQRIELARELGAEIP